MAYKQQHQYTYRDALQKGDPEKVIKGEYFDDEFSAIEGAFEEILGDNSAIDPGDPAFNDVVFQNRTEDQQVVSKFTFAVAGQEPLTVENTGIWAGANYVKYVSADTTWKIFPGLDVDGNIDATGNISMDGNLAIGGVLDGDLTVNGNIIIDGGSIVDPDGNDAGIPLGAERQTLVHDGDKWIATDIFQIYPEVDASKNVRIKGAVESHDGDPVLNERGQQVTALTSGGPISLQLGEYDAELYDAWLKTMHIGSIQGTSANFWITNQSSAGIRIDNSLLRPATSDYDIGSSSNPWGDAHFSGTVNAGTFVKSGGTSAQLLCADGSVADKSSVGGSTDLSDYYTKTEADNAFKPKSYKAPVDSVNGKTGAVSLTASDVGASTFSGNYNDLTNKPTLYTGADAVKTSGNQTIGGIKTFSSDIRCQANVYAYYGSDERLKDEIAPMPLGLIDAIEPATWRWKEDGQASAGVIAQQLQKAGLDDWVREAPNGDLGVDYNALIGMLIAEVQDLKRRLADG